MNAIKNLFTKLYNFVKTIVFIGIVALSFYSGMYFMSAQQNHQDAPGTMIANIEKAFENTSEQPIIMIVPKDSMFEKAKVKLGMEPVQRETIVVETSQATKALGITLKNFKEQEVAEADNGMVKTALNFWSEKGKQAGNGIKSGWSWFSDKVTIIK